MRSLLWKMGGGYREPVCDPVHVHQMRVWCLCEALISESRFWIKSRRPGLYDEPEGIFVFRYEADRMLFRLRWSEELAGQRGALMGMAQTRRLRRQSGAALAIIALALIGFGVGATLVVQRVFGLSVT